MNLLTFIFTATKKIIVHSWKASMLNLSEVHSGLNGTIVNEKLSGISSDTHAKFLKIWSPWITYSAKPNNFGSFKLLIHLYSPWGRRNYLSLLHTSFSLPPIPSHTYPFSVFLSLSHFYSSFSPLL